MVRRIAFTFRLYKYPSPSYSCSRTWVKLLFEKLLNYSTVLNYTNVRIYSTCSQDPGPNQIEHQNELQQFETRFSETTWRWVRNDFLSKTQLSKPTLTEIRSTSMKSVNFILFFKHFSLFMSISNSGVWHCYIHLRVNAYLARNPNFVSST